MSDSVKDRISYSTDGLDGTEVNISAWVASHDFPWSKEELERTDMTSDTRNYVLGLNVAELTLEMFQDFATGGTDKTVGALFRAGTAVEIRIRPEQAVRSADNPEFYFTGKIFAYDALGGSVGDLKKPSIKIKPVKTTFGSPNVQVRTSAPS